MGLRSLNNDNKKPGALLNNKVQQNTRIGASVLTELVKKHIKINSLEQLTNKINDDFMVKFMTFYQKVF